ncbi:MAG: hypothetical protein ABI947_06560 [Chloroflexota bacterium]
MPETIVENCCRTTDDGSTYCITPRKHTADENIAVLNPETEAEQPYRNTSATHNATIWQSIRSVVMFGVACVTSPCCTPLIVPIVLVLLAGTPAAVWITQHLGWVYGGLTLLSVVSLGLGLTWLRQKPETMSRSASRKADSQPTSTTNATTSEVNSQPISQN